MSIVDDILWKLNIVDIIWEHIDLKKTWSNYKWICPFHNEKTPSFIVSEDKQIFKCFWCWKWWNLITFLKDFENIEFYETIKILSEKAGLDIKDYQHNTQKNETELNLKNKILNINKTALTFFHKNLFNDEKALSYVKNERQISSEQIIKYKIWFSWKNNLDIIKYLKWNWFLEDIILKSWIWKKSSSWSIYWFFSNRIIFPIFSNIWEIVWFSWRIFNWETNTWKYINTPETSIYNKSSILYNYNNAKKSKKDYLIVCEWFMDVIWLDKLWYENAVATCWTALTEKHIQLLKRKSKKVIFAFDSDLAWKNASLRWTKIAVSMWLYPWIYFIKNWKDFDEIAQKNLKIDIEEEKQDWILFFINNFLKDFEKSDAMTKQEKLENIYEILQNITNFNIFWDYLEKLSKKIKQDPNILYQQIKNNKNKYHKKWKVKNNTNQNFTIPCLFYNNFYKNIIKNFDLNEILENINKTLDCLDRENILTKILKWNINEQEKEKILETQLLREKNLEWRTNEKIKIKTQKEISFYLINILTKALKNPENKNKKNEIFKIINQIRKSK